MTLDNPPGSTPSTPSRRAGYPPQDPDEERRHRLEYTERGVCESCFAMDHTPTSWQARTCLRCAEHKRGGAPGGAPETLAQAQLDDAHHGKAAPTCQPPPIRFLSTWPDKVLSEDWRSALSTDPDADGVVRAYVRLRRRTPGWSPRRLDRNNHRAIPADKLRGILTSQTGSTTASTSLTILRQYSCATCGSPFNARRSDARYCSPRCRVRAHRAA